MEAPIGYPPPTLIRKRSRLARLRPFIVSVGAVVLVTLTVGRLFDRVPPAAPAPIRAGAVDPKPAPVPGKAAVPAPVTIDAPGAEKAPAQPPVDARQPNQWYYVPVLGDGPGAIYSRSGGQWNYAFACTKKTRMVEIIAVGTGDPGAFDKQSIKVGKVRLMMDAVYSKDVGGTISTTLPAAHPFLAALDGSAPMELQLVATRKAIIPVGPEVVRLIGDCRGRG